MRIFLLPVLLFAALAFTACQDREVVKEEKEIIIEKEIDGDAEPGLMHSVYFWMTDDVDAAGVQTFRTAVQELETIPSVKRLWVGPAAPTEERGVTDNTFDLALIVWFDDVAGHDEYQVHPTHLKFVEAYSNKFAQVKVFDNMVD